MITCKCGSNKFHTFYEWKSKGIKRVRCLVCNRTYEIKGTIRTEIDLQKQWEEYKNNLYNRS